MADPKDEMTKAWDQERYGCSWDELSEGQQADAWAEDCYVFAEDYED